VGENAALFFVQLELARETGFIDRLIVIGAKALEEEFLEFHRGVRNGQKWSKISRE